jgi:hypothetical protein
MALDVRYDGGVLPMTVWCRTRNVLWSALVATGLGCSGGCTDVDADAGVQELGEALSSSDGSFVAVLSLQSDWGSGFCANVKISNAGSAPTTSWNVAIDLKGAVVSSSWNTQLEIGDGSVTATSVAWNAVIAGGSTTDFGFCASTPNKAARPVLLAVARAPASSKRLDGHVTAASTLPTDSIR